MAPAQQAGRSLTDWTRISIGRPAGRLDGAEEWQGCNRTIGPPSALERSQCLGRAGEAPIHCASPSAERAPTAAWSRAAERAGHPVTGEEVEPVLPWLARNLVYRPATWLRGEPVFGLLAQYEASQWWSPEAVQAHQQTALTRILRYAAGHTPHYAEAARSAGLDPLKLDAEDLGQLPILTKIDLVDGSAALQASRPPGTTSWKTTGGSTGVAVRLRKNRFATAAEQAASWRSYRWYGVRPGDRQARFWGTPLQGRARARYRAIDWVLNRSRFSAFAFNRSDLDRYFEELVRDRPHWAYGYVSMLTQFASHCLDRGLPLADLGVRAVVTTSEVLTESDRQTISEAFGAPVYNEYGCGEVGAILYECEKRSLHLMAENLHLELVPDPTDEEPEAHRILVTDLHNLATPLIRYDIADRVVPAGHCACGRGLPAFSRVFGRAYDFVETADGTRYHGEFFMYMLEEARDAGAPILQAQFVQETADRMRIRVVGGDGYTEAHGALISARLASKSEGRITAEIERVDGLERERSGKIRLIRALESAAR